MASTTRWYKSVSYGIVLAAASNLDWPGSLGALKDGFWKTERLAKMSCTGRNWRGDEIGLIVDADGEVDEVGELVARLPVWAAEADSCDCGAIQGGGITSEYMLATEV